MDFDSIEFVVEARRLVDALQVRDRLHLNGTGSGSPTVLI
jgi:hypothetical protein